MDKSNSSDKWLLIIVMIIVFVLAGLIIWLLVAGSNHTSPVSLNSTAATSAPSARPAPGPNIVAPSASAIKVGWLVSQYIANSKDYGAGYFNHVAAIHARFVDPSIELFALVEPDSLNNPAQQNIISRYFLPDHTVVLTDPTALAKVNVIVISRAFVLKQQDAQAIDQAVRNGAGLLIHVGLNRFEGFPTPDSELMQIDNPESFWTRAPIPCQVVSDDPLLSGLKSLVPDGHFTISNLNGTAGILHGTPLIIAEQSSTHENPTSAPTATRQMVPMYIAHLGKGAIINCQWDSIPPELVQASKGRFYIHCCQYLAGRKLD